MYQTRSCACDIRERQRCKTSYGFSGSRFGQIDGHIKKRKRWMELLHILKYMRSRYQGKLYIILDNFSPHLKNEVTSWCKKNNIELVFLPTNASWLNRIECHFAALRKFTIRNSNYQSHEELASEIRRYIIWRNKNHEDKTVKPIENRVNFL